MSDSVSNTVTSVNANANADKQNTNHQNGKNSKNRNRNRNKNTNKSSGPTKPSPDEQKQNQPPQVVTVEAEDDDDDDDDAPEHHHCLICYSSHLHQERGITPCHHDSVCASCHLRLRSLLDDKRCPICKATNHEIIVDADIDPLIDHHKSFEEYEKWGDDIGPNHTYREDVGMFFPTVYLHTKVLPLFALSCNTHRCHFKNDSSESNSPGTRKALISHLATHNPPLQICDLCITFKRDFISRLPRFSANQLKEHNKHGDLGAGRKASGSGKANKGHPICQFCQPKRFYDLTELHKHLNKEHYECFVCKKMETPLQFFKDYNKLNLHFDREHYLCRFPECLASRFVVFPNEIDLKAHERDMHGLVSGGSTKIQMEFRVRASGRDGSGVEQVQQQVPSEEDFGFALDGGVFVPESLDDAGATDNRQSNEQEISHGPHAKRTALLREHAKMKREEMGVTGDSGESEAFPSLAKQGAGNLISWSREGERSTVSQIRGRNTTALNDSNFPSLGGPSETKTNKMTSKLRATKSANGQFSAMTRAANASTSTSRPFANAALTSGYGGAGMKAKASLSADNFPSLGGAMSSGMSMGGSNGYGGAGMKAKANLSADNFPSLGGATPRASMGMSSNNKYAAAQAFAKKKNSKSSGISFDLDQHFPAPSMSNSTKVTTKKNSAFEKKPDARVATNGFLAFPPPQSSIKANGVNQVEGMKQVLGLAKYKQLKRSTKDFATGSLDPESYITSVVSLFDGGVKDPSLWEFIPNLISSCPNESNTKRALRYLESMRYSSGQTATSEPAVTSSSQSASSGWASTAAAAGSVLASTRHVAAPLQYGRAAAYAASISAKQSLSTGFTGRSLPVTQIKKKNLWNGSNSGVAANAGSALAAAAARPPQNGTATKFMAKEISDQRKAKHAESLIKQGATAGKSKKSKAKKNELRDLAFGKS